MVFVVEFADALVGEGEALAQRGVGAGLDAGGGGLAAGWRSAGGVGRAVRLGVEPGAGDAGVGGDLGDGAPLAGFAEFVQGLVRVGGCRRGGVGQRQEVVAVVRAHRMIPFRSMFRCPLQRTGVAVVGLEGGDDSEQVGFDRSVHLGQAVVTVGFGMRDQARVSLSCCGAAGGTRRS